MIRFLLLLVVFGLGLLAAGLWFGQMHHMRTAVPQALPGWTEALPDDAGLRGGRMPLAGTGFLPPVEVTWEALPPDTGGLRWRVRATGDGIDLSGDLTVSFWPDTARLSGVAGTVALDRVGGGQADLDGLLVLREGAAEARGLLRSPVVSVGLSGELRGIEAGGAAFGDGPVTATIAEDGGWRAEMRLAGGASPVAGSLDGAISRRTAALDVVVARDGSLPSGFRDLLSRVGRPEGDGWRVTIDVPLY